MFTSPLLNGMKKGKEWQLCYLNSVLQALCPILKEWISPIVKIPVSKLEKYHITKEAFATAIFFDEMIRTTSVEALDPRPLLSVLDPLGQKFPLGIQHDANHFLLFLLEKINDLDLYNFFSITFRKAIQCTKCGHTLYKDEKENSNRLEFKNLSLFLELPLKKNQ